MPGFDPEHPVPTPMRRQQEEATGPTPAHIRPPSLEDFAEATYLAATGPVERIFAKVVKFKEFSDLSGVPGMIVWRRLGKPHFSGDTEDRRFAGVELINPLNRWIATQLEAPGWPRFVLNLFWLHLDELREDSKFVLEKELERHIFTALLQAEVGESGAVTLRPMSLDLWGMVVARYGPATDGLLVLQKQLSLWQEAHPALAAAASED